MEGQVEKTPAGVEALEEEVMAVNEWFKTHAFDDGLFGLAYLTKDDDDDVGVQFVFRFKGDGGVDEIKVFMGISDEVVIDQAFFDKVTIPERFNGIRKFIGF